MSQHTIDDVTMQPSERGEVPRATQDRYGRRRLMLGVAAACAGLTGFLAGRPDTAGASDGEALELGTTNIAVKQTLVINEVTTAFQGATSAEASSGILGADSSVHGGIGVSGMSKNGTGVLGKTTAPRKAGAEGNDNSPGGGFGVLGTSQNGTGVLGTTTAPRKAGAEGDDNSPGGGFGVLGTSQNGTGVKGTTAADGQVGVAGLDGSVAGGIGVSGTSQAGTGVSGETSADGMSGVSGTDASTGGGNGILGKSASGTGVTGKSGVGSGVAAQNNSTTNPALSATNMAGVGIYTEGVGGSALQVNGSVEFASSGTLAIGSGDSSVTFVTTGLTTTSMILATLQTAMTTSEDVPIAVASASLDAGTPPPSFTITLTAAATASAIIAWFVIELLDLSTGAP